MRSPVLSSLSALLVAGCAASLPEGFRALDGRSGAALAPAAEVDAPPATHDLAAADLSLTAVTAEVLAKNQRLVAMRHTLRAMVAMVPQAAATPDPTLELGTAPLAIPTGRGQRLAFRQGFPWPGTLAAKASVALADAQAMEHDVEAMAQAMVAMAHMAYWELAAVAPTRALWHEHHTLIETLRKATLGQLQAGRARPRDVVTAEGELVMAEQMLLDVDRMDKVARARLNTAMQRLPNAPLGNIALPGLPPAPPPLDALLAQVEARAEVKAARARVEARDKGVTAAERMNAPMLGWGVEVSTMGEDWMMWPMLMVMIELPLATARRDAMVDEARARVRSARAEVDALTIELMREVAERHAELEEARARYASYETLVVPTIERRLQSTTASYGTGQDDFDAVMMAATALNQARLGRLTARVDALVAATRLELALGRVFREPAAEVGR